MNVLGMCDSQDASVRLAGLSTLQVVLQHSVACAAALKVSIRT